MPKIKNKNKLQNILKQIPEQNIRIQFSRSSETNTNQKKSSSFSQKQNYADFLNLKTLFKNNEFYERKQTFNTFIKPNRLLLENENASNNFFVELRRNTNLNNYLMMKNLHEHALKPTKKKGLMFTNELWGEQNYRKIVNNSDLKPKYDYLKLNQKIKLFHEIVHELDFSKKNIKNDTSINKTLIDSFFPQDNSKHNEIKIETKKEKKKISESHASTNEKNWYTLSEKIKHFSKLQTSELEKDKFKLIIQEKIRVCENDDPKNLESLRVFRNRALHSIKQKKHSREIKLNAIHQSQHNLSNNLDKSYISANSDIHNISNQTNGSIKPRTSFFNCNIKNRRINHRNFILSSAKEKTSELLKSCDEEKFDNRTLKKYKNIYLIIIYR